MNHPPMCRLQWEENQIAWMCFSQPTDTNDREIRTSGLGLLYILHTVVAFHELWMQHSLPGAGLTYIPGGFSAPTPGGEGGWWDR